MVYAHTNNKGVVYYLHTVPSKTTGKPLFFFSKTQNNKGHKMIDLPEGYEVVENPRSNLPMIRRKK